MYSIVVDFGVLWLWSAIQSTLKVEVRTSKSPAKNTSWSPLGRHKSALVTGSNHIILCDQKLGSILAAIIIKATTNFFIFHTNCLKNMYRISKYLMVYLSFTRGNSIFGKLFKDFSSFLGLETRFSPESSLQLHVQLLPHFQMEFYFYDYWVKH